MSTWKATSSVDRSKRRQQLRLLIQGEELLKFVLEAADALAAMGRQVDEDGNPVPCSANKVGALKAAADIKLRVLDKVLPDLKSIEHELGEGLLSMNDQELHARIEQLSKRLAESGLLEGGALRVGAAARRGTETLQ